VAENYANNMRLYEATGVGSLLITDRKDNLGNLFEVGKEVVAYSTQEEASELIRHYLAHPDEAEAIAKAGQARTLRDHTYKRRMDELVPILQHYLEDVR
jgi:spore maturation protein CgeB